ncbi:MAG: hypothetical protein LBL87_06430 [Ruminococcus sp.]|nr:hypothetical protein [Ruminococcus sp.]
MKTKIYWIAKTAMFIALLVALQAVTKPMGQFVTGSVVNLILILSVVIGGIASGACVAVISPLMAYLLGIAPNQALVPFIILGNISIVLVWWFFGKLEMKNETVPYIIALVTGAIVKFGVLFLSVNYVAIPYVLKLPAEKAGVISAQFGIAQLITAVIGGAVAVAAIPLLKKAIAGREKAGA